MFRVVRTTFGTRSMSTVSITKNVHFKTIAREWRLKWTPENDKASLSAVQDVLSSQIAAVKKVPGVQRVQRIVCGGCHDFKVIVAMDVASFKAWEAKEFYPEASFLKAVKAVPGVSKVETQTYTLMDV
jgi:hypothetical protein